jgi:hypothetical protein
MADQRFDVLIAEDRHGDAAGAVLRGVPVPPPRVVVGDPRQLPPSCNRTTSWCVVRSAATSST